MKRINKYIPWAIDEVEKTLLNENGKIDKEMNGYLSSFGASIISSDLLPAVIFFSQKGKTKSDRRKILTVIENLINDHDLQPELVENKLLKTVKEWHNDVNKKHDYNRLTDIISDLTAAIKLAIRVFPNEKQN